VNIEKWAKLEAVVAGRRRRRWRQGIVFLEGGGGVRCLASRLGKRFGVGLKGAIGEEGGRGCAPSRTSADYLCKKEKNATRASKKVGAG